MASLSGTRAALDSFRWYRRVRLAWATSSVPEERRAGSGILRIQRLPSLFLDPEMQIEVDDGAALALRHAGGIEAAAGGASDALFRMLVVDPLPHRSL